MYPDLAIGTLTRGGVGHAFFRFRFDAATGRFTSRIATAFDQRGYGNLTGRDLPYTFFKLRFNVESDELQTRFGLGSSEGHGLGEPGSPGNDDGKDYSPVPKKRSRDFLVRGLYYRWRRA